MRLMSKRAYIYTEMLNCNAIIKNHKQILRRGEHTGPTVCQLGGNCPDLMSQAAYIAINEYGYDEVNINCGCPSDKV